MKPAEEDVMAEAIYTQWIKEGIGGRKTTAELLRLAIRAAYAKGVEDERERLAQAFSGVYACCCDVPYSGGDLSDSIRRGPLPEPPKG